MKPLRYFLSAFVVLFLCTLSASAQGNYNIGFEDSSFTGWSGYYGNWSSTPVQGCCVTQTGDPVSPQVGLPAPPPPGQTEYRHTITSGTGVDPNVPQIPLVSPFGGAHSVFLNDYSTGGNSAKISRSFEVSAEAPLFTYQYAVVFQDPSHAPWEQPKFIIKVTDTAGQYLVGGYYKVAAAANIPGFQNGACCDIRYRNWSQVALDLTDYIGQTINIAFEVSDCALAGHYGYAYVDAVCGTIDLTCDYCFGDTSANIQAPPGYLSYLWSTGQTTSNITVSQPIPGDSVTVTCQPYHPYKPATVLKYFFPTAVEFDANFTVDASCNSTTATLIDSSTINAQGTQLNSWQWKVNGSTISTQQQPVYDFTQPGNYNIEVIVKDTKGCADTSAKQITIEEPMTVTPLLSKTEQYNGYGVSCVNSYDGTAEVSVSHAVQPINYTWDILGAPNSAAVSSLPAGVYDVTVTDNKGCQITTNVQLSPPPALTANPVAQHILCYGESTGSIALNASGGAGTLNYTWHHDNQLNSSTLTGLSENTYMYTVIDANSCSVTGTATVTNAVQNALQVTPSTTDIKCVGDLNGEIALIADGGAGSYSYHWAHNNSFSASNITGLGAGQYAATVTDANNCSATTTVFLEAPQAINTAPTIENVSCYGAADGSINMHTSGGTGSLTTWWPHDTQLNSDIAQSLAAGSYTVTVTDENNCTLTTTVSITQPAEGYNTPTATVTDASTKDGCDGSIALDAVTGNTAPYTYAWSTTPAQTSDNASELCAGTYTVTVSDQNNCTTTAAFTVSEPLETGIAQANTLDAVRLWPNPYQNELSIANVPQGAYSVMVTNAIGQQVLALNKAKPSAAGTILLPMQELPKGIYTVTLQQGKQQISLRAVKQ